MRHSAWLAFSIQGLKLFQGKVQRNTKLQVVAFDHLILIVQQTVRSRLPEAIFHTGRGLNGLELINGPLLFQSFQVSLQEAHLQPAKSNPKQRKKDQHDPDGQKDQAG